MIGLDDDDLHVTITASDPIIACRILLLHDDCRTVQTAEDSYEPRQECTRSLQSGPALAVAGDLYEAARCSWWYHNTNHLCIVGIYRTPGVIHSAANLSCFKTYSAFGLIGPCATT